MNQIYIHYGSDKFEPEKFQPIKNKMLSVKPTGGLWASPVNAKEGWRQWCERNNFQYCDLKKIFCLWTKTRD